MYSAFIHLLFTPRLRSDAEHFYLQPVHDKVAYWNVSGSDLTVSLGTSEPSLQPNILCVKKIFLLSQLRLFRLGQKPVQMLYGPNIQTLFSNSQRSVHIPVGLTKGFGSK